MTFFKSLSFLAVLAVLAGPAAAGNLVVNPGFETGDFTGWSGGLGDGIGIDNSFPNTGSYDAAFGTYPTDQTPGILSQVITTVPGESYVLSFALLDEPGTADDTFYVTFGGFSMTITGDQAASYTKFSFPIDSSNVTSTSTTLSFEGLSASSDWNLDDVSVTQVVTVTVPEPSTWALLLVAVAGFGLHRPLRATTQTRRGMTRHEQALK